MTTSPTDQVDKLQFSFDQWREKFLRTILYGTAGIGLIALLSYVFAESNPVFIGAAVGFYVVLLLFTFLRMPYWLRAGFFAFLFYLISLATLMDTGIRGEAALFFLGFIVISTLILSPRSGWHSTVISLLTYAIVGLLVFLDRYTLQNATIGAGLPADWILIGVYIVMLSAIIINAIRLTQNEFKRAHERADIVLGELIAERSNLEERVAERTAELNQGKTELELANTINERRARQFEAISLVTRTIVSLQDLQDVLTRVTESISSQFGYYHIGIFLIDDTAEYAVLTATNSTGGKNMLARHHRLEIGKVGIVGHAAATKVPRIALDTGKDAVFFNNPDLPETRSEIALPLKLGAQIIGVLDVQSKEPNAFGDDDLAVFPILADQIAIAIQNARLYENAQKMLAETRKMIGTQLQDAWEDYRRATSQIGYQITGRTLKPINDPVTNQQIQQSLATGQTVTQPAKKNNPASMAIPIILRGKVIGIMNVQESGLKKWDQDNVDIAQAIAERLSLAIENATLIETSRRRAAKERAIGDITAKIGSSINLQNILQTAVEELGRTLPHSEVVIQFQGKENA